MNRPRGRPTENRRTRERITREARDLFLEKGYRRATLRAVAAAAEVDVALIGYYFGSKHGLFAAAMALPQAPSRMLVEALEGDRSGAPERLLKAVTDLWENPELRAPMTVLTRTAISEPHVMRAFREYLEREVLTRIAEFIGGPDATERARAAVTVLGGLVYTRYVVSLNGTAELSPADVRRILTPVLRQAMARSARLPLALG